MDDKFRTLDLNLLRVFEAVIEEANVTRAAERLNLTQPAVSNAIARLRETFGDALFERTSSGVVPTATARELWYALEPHFVGMREALAPKSFDPTTCDDHVRIAMTDYTIERVVPRLSAYLQDHAPRLRLDVVPYGHVDLPTLFEKDNVDILLGTYLNDLLHRNEFNTHALWRVHHSLIMRRGHALHKESIDLDEFLNARHIDYRTGGMTAGIYDQVLAARGYTRNLVLTLHSHQQALAVIAGSDCVAVLPNSLVATSPFAESLVIAEPPIPVPPRPFWIIWRHRHTSNPTHAWVRSVIIELFDEHLASAER
ncbi:MAG: LysR family transcriptional regulator [Variovorax sp.]|nr:LysR family transcriptional regulator [Variovorax sp.]